MYIHHLEYKQNPYGSDTRSYRFRILLGQFGALANELTSFWRRCRGFCFLYLVVAYFNLEAIILYSLIL